MNYRNHELLSELAAQYVLGTLRGPARQRFARLLEVSEEARECIAFWEGTLSQLGLLVAPVTPPTAARLAMLESAFRFRQPLPDSQPAPEPIAPSIKTASPYQSAFRRRVRFLAAACACGVAFVLGAIQFAGGRLSFPDQNAAPGQQARTEAPISSSQARIRTTSNLIAVDNSSPPPTYLAKLGMPTSSMQWMISLSADHRQLSITASEDYLNLGRGCVQLWWLTGSEPPKPLAILGTERDSTVVVDMPSGLDAGKTIVFAISIEPRGGSPTGRPTGPVLDQAINGQAI